MSQSTIIKITNLLILFLPVLIAVAFFNVKKKFPTQLARQFVREFIVPLFVLFASLLCFIGHTWLYDPYDSMIQTLTLIGILVFNAVIFSLYSRHRRLAFMSLCFNCLLVYMYIKLSTFSNFPVSAFYYIIIFIGFHLFEGTVTARFLQRTKIIFTGYLKSSEYVKAFLWVFLVFIPSFMTHPVPLFMVCQPLILHAYLFHFDYILCGLSMLYFWCILLGLANRFGIGISFLRKCSNYFTRRACLHYIGHVW